MKKGILICLIFLTAIVCCSVVSAESNTFKVGDITSSSFATSQSYSGAGNSFSISSDGSINPNGNSKVDLNYKFSAKIDISDAKDKVKSSLSSVSSDDKAKCDFVISDGNSHFKFTNVPCSVHVKGNTMTVKGSNSQMGVHGISVDLDNCDITNCTVTVKDDNNQTTVYQTT